MFAYTIFSKWAFGGFNSLDRESYDTADKTIHWCYAPLTVAVTSDVQTKRIHMLNCSYYQTEEKYRWIIAAVSCAQWSMAERK